MTKISEYQLLACPHCSQIHRKAEYSSINFSVSPDFLKKMASPKVCFNCEKPIEISQMLYIGTKEVKPIVPDHLRPENRDLRSTIQKIKDLIYGRKFVIKIVTKEDQSWFNYPVI